MTMPDEHDDDLDSEVVEGAEIETEKFEQAEDEEEVAPMTRVTNPSRSVEEGRMPAGAKEEEEPEDESSDTI
ncbi:MAG: hypothetical protein DMG04_21950 [Acidobacteria bacterium]|nr:MAG: hypothetical protein DMG04_21950 [Acidobacteriota bacterium]PYQ79818.1 MAG: hypothetical protein DMG03_24705 [Acidobacteriota bacterium]PYQ87629.1 MAG: hypothetical protein DMG02_20270 [Acidobacteriota bacterium]PYR10004.1 MAG: hypothetical protein DMF99_13245 [Acidobacteriota bacterium]